MPLKPKNRFTLKIISGYLILGALVILAGIFIHSEFKKYTAGQDKGNSDTKLLQTNALLASLYEAENLSKLALQNREKKNFQAYAKKVDTIFSKIEALKVLAKKTGQVNKLESVQELLKRKVYNNAELRKLKERNINNAPIDSLLKAFDQMEIDLGRITPESLVPNFEALPEPTQNSLKEYVALLNRNIPKNTSATANRNEIDSILYLSKSILNDAKVEHEKIEQNMLGKELQIYKSDLELSQQLRSIISAFEQEIILDAYSESQGKQQLLRRSSTLAWTTAVLGFLVICTFTFLTANDYWKGQLLREQLEKEKQFSDSVLKSREQLISTVSHDLRSPLNTIKGYTELLEIGAGKTISQQYLKNMKSAMAYVENLVNDLLDFSKLEAGKVSIETKPYLLSALLDDIAKDFEEISLMKSVPLNIEVGEDLKNPIIGDSFRVRQILTNLIGNALKFTKEGFVKVHAFCEKEHKNPKLKIRIIDTGVGIEKVKQDKIFKEFEQVDGVVKERHSGYGLGLTISKKLATLLGGKIALESEINKGSTFTLTLPLLFTSSDGNNPEDDLPVRTSDLSLAVLDDDVILLELIQELCKLNGIPCTTFSSYVDFSKARELEYTLLLSDIEMRPINGFDVVASLKKGNVAHYRNQPILAMTGQRGVVKSSYLTHGFSDVIPKPFSSDAFLTLLSKYASNYEYTIPNNKQNEKHITELFSLKLVSSFVADKKGLDELLTTFLENSDINITLLKKAIKKDDHPKIRAIAHKMLPMFRQLQISCIVPILEDFEVLTGPTPTDKLLEQLAFLQASFLKVKSAMQLHMATPSVDIG